MAYFFQCNDMRGTRKLFEKSSSILNVFPQLKLSSIYADNAYFWQIDYNPSTLHLPQIASVS